LVETGFPSQGKSCNLFIINRLPIRTITAGSFIKHLYWHRHYLTALKALPRSLPSEQKLESKNNGASPRAIQLAMGHNSLETTMGNLHAESLSVRIPLESILDQNADPEKNTSCRPCTSVPKKCINALARIVPTPTLPRGIEAPLRTAFKSYFPCKNSLKLKTKMLKG
jgi:hypothetical protein